MKYVRVPPSDVLDQLRELAQFKGAQKRSGATYTHDFTAGSPERNFYRGLKAEWAVSDILGVECRALAGKPDEGFDLKSRRFIVNGPHGTIDVKFRSNSAYGIPYDSRDHFRRSFTSDHAALCTTHGIENDPLDPDTSRAVRWVGWIGRDEWLELSHRWTDHKGRSFLVVSASQLHSPRDWLEPRLI